MANPKKLKERISELTNILWELQQWYDSRSESWRQRTNQTLWYRVLPILYAECNYCAFERIFEKATRDNMQVSISGQPDEDVGKPMWTVYVCPKDVVHPHKFGRKYFAMSCPEKPTKCECWWEEE